MNKYELNITYQMKTQNNLFKARASASGKLMTTPRSKTETLSETTKLMFMIG